MEKTIFSVLFCIRKTRLNKRGKVPILFIISVNGLHADGAYAPLILTGFLQT